MQSGLLGGEKMAENARRKKGIRKIILYPLNIKDVIAPIIAVYDTAINTQASPHSQFKDPIQK